MMNQKHFDEPTLKLAVLIDADNARSFFTQALLTEIASYGDVIVKRIYGDFTTGNGKWKNVLHRYAIKPVQQFSFTSGKNANDSALIIDAMDLLYTKRLDGFCIVSSDSDFTNLAYRIREEGLQVFGFGEKKTPEAFRNACNKFIITEVLSDDVQTISAKHSPPITASPPNTTHSILLEFPKEFILEALKNSLDDTGWASLGVLGSYLIKLKPDFDSRLYGFKKLSDLVKEKSELFELEERMRSGTQGKTLYVRERVS